MSSHGGEFCTHTHRRMALSIVVVAVAMTAEVIGGFASNSLALLSDAGHMLTDLVALTLSWLAYKFAVKESDACRSYGYHRFQVMAAFVNGVSLFVVAILIVCESAKRFIYPVEVHWQIMLIVALLGLVANVTVFVILYRKDEHNLNIKSAVLHVVGDLLSSVAAVLSSIVIMLSGWQIIDPLLSVFASGLMFYSAFRIVKSSGNILLEGKPENIDIEEVRNSILGNIPAVIDIHHVHLWSLTHDYPIMTMHVKVHAPLASDKAHSALLISIKKLLNEKFGISHVTIEIECGECSDAS
ncbi:putative Co/Zn/Cd efflux system component CzcD [Anaplasma centrale str. Israel]|uniref:Putative Co/Zn/Cd efflux system component CzcD n=1 Tax=Anaplasma centrale (strain Israel) TaxID=574556 RepID=D1ATN9_ANACI|nr:cation diffusion facilitator family transporter [Anaplasma centrale]ACZ48917.1 putative Co/Zn/Cd efflux system component CzcD [Anaplasma centrale str. Israel]